ncbi:hypothetical protein AB0M43_07130 [Longispora sp. NPDC051575]|uniref:hypothetical protein n=1 Tax=Longispora sp. NPDC051575 TaxID=3154943 RepID=UPI003448C970
MWLSRRGRSWWSGLAAVGVVLLVLAALVFVLLALRSGPVARQEAWDRLASVGSLVLGVGGFGIGVLGAWAALRTPPSDPDVQLDRALADLVQRLRAQWDAEAEDRGLSGPDPIPVRWRPTGRAVQPALSEVVFGPGWRAKGLRLRGGPGDLARCWLGLPLRQLVVIGEPGGGKTSLAVLLVTGVLRSWAPGDPTAVPVLVNLAGWDPRVRHLDTWFAGRLVEQYPFLADRDRYGPDVAARLVAARRVAPVLDGLDEMPTGMHSEALARLSRALGGRPVVLTCRTDEYEAACRKQDRPFGKALVVEIEPVTARQAAVYLAAGGVAGTRRWAPVLDVLAAEPTGPLAAALSTPLTVFLARVVYRAVDRDPAELTRFADATAITDHLLDAFLPAVYDDPGPPAPGTPRHPRYPAERARHWLTFLATRLREPGDNEMAWWRLARLLGPRWDRTAPAVLVTLAAAAPFGFRAEALIVAGLLVSTTFFRVGEVLPRRIALQPWRTLMSLGLCSVPTAVTFLLARDAELFPHWQVLWGAFFFALALAMGLGGPLSRADLLDPLSTLRDDRRSAVAAGVPAALLVGVPAWILLGPLYGLRFAAGAAIVIGLGSLPGEAWVRFTIARFALAARGDLPWRLVRFLADARRRGMLRQTGAAYQFRHLRLQERILAANPEPAPARSEPENAR